jgi:murein DD-endopeptidase MepM/ murein hydrolase activator NlpD
MTRFRQPTRLAAVALAISLGAAPLYTSAQVGSGAQATGTPARPKARWQWPISPPHPLIRNFEAPPSDFGAGHRGIDISAEVGSIVVAPEAGVATFVGWVVDRPVLSIGHGDGVRSSYEPVDALVAEGTAVVRGQPLATVASSRHCEGSCLHVGVRKNGRYLSPLTFLNEMRRAVLVPLDRVTPADAPARKKTSIARPRRAYKSVSFRGLSGPASLARHANRRRRRGGG